MEPVEHPQALDGKIYKDGDYTFYYSAEKNPKEFEKYSRILSKSESQSGLGGESKEIYYSQSTRREICGEPIAGQGKKTVEGRMLICRCYQNREIAVTFRQLTKLEDKEWNKIERPRQWRSGYLQYTERDSGRKYPVEMSLLGSLLGDLTTKQPAFGSNPTGLLLITGSTNSSKSELTRKLIVDLLKVQVNDYCAKKRPRRPHLLTFEDPIEKWLFQKNKDTPNSQIALDRGIEYTPREKNVDVGSLKEAIDDALRQTPSIFYVGEVREDCDWKELLRFAGTGHLVIATSHAGSLIEAMERIFRGVEAKTPAERGQIAQRILGVVHQLRFNLQDFFTKIKFEKHELQDLGIDPNLLSSLSGELPKGFEVLLPALWRRTPAGVASIVSDGFSSILPNNPDGEDRDRISSFGRRYFANQISKDNYFDNYLLSMNEDVQKNCESLFEKSDLLNLPKEQIAALYGKKIRTHFITESIRYDLMGV